MQTPYRKLFFNRNRHVFHLLTRFALRKSYPNIQRIPSQSWREHETFRHAGEQRMFTHIQTKVSGWGHILFIFIFLEHI